jgi:hypothetical protein
MERLLIMKRYIAILLLLFGCLLVPGSARAAAPGWVVTYDTKGGVTVTAGTDVVYTDVDSLMLIQSNPWHGVYGWANFPWATNMAHPNEVDSKEGTKKVVTFSDPPGGPVQLTKQVTEISPTEIKIIIKMVTSANAPGNLLSYDGVLPAATYNGATFTTDGVGYDFPGISPLTTDWGAKQNGGGGDDMRYNVTTATFNVKSLNGQPATLVYTLSETPVSPGTPPNVRGWRVNNGKGQTGSPNYTLTNNYQFDATAPFERDIEIRISWKSQ